MSTFVGDFPYQQFPGLWEGRKRGIRSKERQLYIAIRYGLSNAVRDLYIEGWASAHKTKPLTWISQEKSSHLDHFLKTAERLIEYQIQPKALLFFAIQYYRKLKFPTPAQIHSQNLIDALLALNPNHQTEEVDLALAEENARKVIEEKLLWPTSADLSPLGSLGVRFDATVYPRR